jgi:hypothetical protein
MLRFNSLHCSICIASSWLRVSTAAKFNLEFGLQASETGHVVMYTWKSGARTKLQNTEAAVECSKELSQHRPGQTEQYHGRCHNAVNISGIRANN